MHNGWLHVWLSKSPDLKLVENGFKDPNVLMTSHSCHEKF